MKYAQMKTHKIKEKLQRWSNSECWFVELETETSLQDFIRSRIAANAQVLQPVFCAYDV